MGGVGRPVWLRAPASGLRDPSVLGLTALPYFFRFDAILCCTVLTRIATKQWI